VTFARLSPAAAKNGARGPSAPSNPPIAGPTMNPTPNIALTTPKLCARRSGGLMSATYAYAGVNDAPAIPASVRPTNSQVNVGAKPMMR
jgi:hypothetical protein